MIRNNLGVPEPTEADIRRMQDRANAWHDCPATPERLADINELATRYYEQRFIDSWARPYLIERFHEDLTGSIFRPGYAPDGWTGLVTHLRRQGATDEEMLAVGVAATASTGRLIDRFRDRVVFPITREGRVLGFVGRRNPMYADNGQHGPKYLNTPDTPLFHNGAQLFVAGDPAGDATPVLVEGPMDAIAVAMATSGKAIGLAPLGTSLTDEQAAQLHALSRTPVIATDADHAGRTAAERDYWILAPFGIDPLHAKLPDGNDPADLVARRRQEELLTAIRSARPLADALVDELLDRAPKRDATLDALRVVAAGPPARWAVGVQRIAEPMGLPSSLLQSALIPLTRAWNADQRHAARQITLRMARVESYEDPERVDSPAGTTAPSQWPRPLSTAVTEVAPRR